MVHEYSVTLFSFNKTADHLNLGFVFDYVLFRLYSFLYDETIYWGKYANGIRNWVCERMCVCSKRSKCPENKANSSHGNTGLGYIEKQETSVTVAQTSASRSLDILRV